MNFHEERLEAKEEEVVEVNKSQQVYQLLNYLLNMV